MDTKRKYEEMTGDEKERELQNIEVKDETEIKVGVVKTKVGKVLRDIAVVLLSVWEAIRLVKGL